MGVKVGVHSSIVLFIFHKDLEDKAIGVIPALPPFMQELVGPRIWTWFHKDAKLDLVGFKWDPQCGMVPTNKAEGWLGEGLEEWEDKEGNRRQQKRWENSLSTQAQAL